MYGAGDLLRSISTPTEADKPMIIELAVAAMEELIRMAQMGEPLWMTNLDGTSILNEEEYIRTFPRGIGPRPTGFKYEASRETAVVIMNHINLVEILMDVVGFILFCEQLGFASSESLLILSPNIYHSVMLHRISGLQCFPGSSQEL